MMFQRKPQCTVLKHCNSFAFGRREPTHMSLASCQNVADHDFILKMVQTRCFHQDVSAILELNFGFMMIRCQPCRNCFLTYGRAHEIATRWVIGHVAHRMTVMSLYSVTLMSFKFIIFTVIYSYSQVNSSSILFEVENIGYANPLILSF